MGFPSAQAAVFHISMTRFSLPNDQAVCGQGHIAHGHDQPPCQDETADHSTQNEVERKQRQAAATGSTLLMKNALTASLLVIRENLLPYLHYTGRSGRRPGHTKNHLQTICEQSSFRLVCSPCIPDILCGLHL